LIGLGPIVLDFPYILEELTAKSNQRKSTIVSSNFRGNFGTLQAKY
jgi:hypothetical protein